MEPRVPTGAEKLIQCLEREGVEYIFGYSGGAAMPIFDALVDSDIKLILVRHEQGAAHMADGYARVSGKEGVFVVVPGPGLLNTTAALSTAYSCNSPVLCVTGQIRSDLIDLGRGLLHEIPNQLEMIRSVTKHSARAVRPEARLRACRAAVASRRAAPRSRRLRRRAGRRPGRDSSGRGCRRA